jgi:altronate dehydratase large subunit
MQLRGYRRKNGEVGIRNHVLIMSSVVCANEVTDRIFRAAPGTVPVRHQHGCGQLGADYEQTKRTLIGFGVHPNVAGVIVVGLGCEKVEAADVAAAIVHQSGKPVETVIIQKEGGTTKAVAKGVALAEKMLAEAAKIERVPISVSDLILGLECGGSDTTSGLASNPALGVASDLLIADGGTAILSETAEMIGAEHLLAQRAVTPKIAAELLKMVKTAEESALKMGVDFRGTQPSPGNIRGGLTTIEEKSLGCLRKAGTGKVEGVLKYAEKPAGKGLYIMDTPGFDLESVTGKAAGGCQLLVFTTGMGTPVGCPVMPVLKITGNKHTFEKMVENMDMEVSGVIKGTETIESAGRRLYKMIKQVANGKLTQAEILQHYEFAITRIGPSI